MQPVLIVKGKGPNFRSLHEKNPLGRGGEGIEFQVIPVKMGIPSPFSIKGTLIALFKEIEHDEDSIGLILRYYTQHDTFFFVALYNHTTRMGEGVIYGEQEFCQLAMGQIRNVITGKGPNVKC